MNDQNMTFEKADRIGRVSAVDTSTVLVDVEDPQLMSRVGIGNLVAIKGSSESEYLIGMADRIRRTLRDELFQDGDDLSIPTGPTSEDCVRVLLVGTFRTVHGDERNVFKRGADSFPQIERDCYIIEGGNLQSFMGLLGAEFSDEEQGDCV